MMAFCRRAGLGSGVALVAFCTALSCGGVPPPGLVGPGGPDSSAPVDAAQAPASPANFADVSFPDAAAYADVNVPVSFTQPVWLPPARTTIEGDATSLVGSWVEGDRQLYLKIEQAADGGVHGTIHGEGHPSGMFSCPQLSGPFAPAADPNVGYPTTVAPDAYFYAEQFLSYVDYQLFDGVLSNGSFTFWFSMLDLWTDWCAMQTPFTWNVGGAVKYRCVPQTADPSTTDLGKLALCRSGQDGPECFDQNGFDEPCACFDDAGVVNVSLPLCGSAVCECSASQCRAHVRTQELSGNLELNAGQLTGTIELGEATGGVPRMTFQKVTP